MPRPPWPEGYSKISRLTEGLARSKQSRWLQLAPHDCGFIGDGGSKGEIAAVTNMTGAQEDCSCGARRSEFLFSVEVVAEEHTTPKDFDFKVALGLF